MPEEFPYMKQLDAVPDNLTLSTGQIDYINRSYLPKLAQTLGVELNPGASVPESGGVPRLFLLNENEPNRPRALGEEG